MDGWPHIVGSTPHPDEVFMRQIGRTLTAVDEGVLASPRVLIWDRDSKWACLSGGTWRMPGSGSFRPRFKRPMPMPDRLEMDIRERPVRSFGRARGDPPAGKARAAGSD